MGKLRFRYILPALLGAMALSGHFYRDNYRNVDDLLPQTLQEPVQTELAGSPRVFSCDRDGHFWEYTTVFNYDISGLVFGASHKLLSWYNGAVPADIGILWGENASRGLYKNVKLRVRLSHYMAYIRSGTEFRMDQASNNHIATCNPAVSEKVRSILTGDQVRIRGWLVNGRVMPARGETRPEKIGIWNSSATRKDGGEGACELVYVEKPEDITILKRGPMFWEIAYHVCLYAFVAGFAAAVFLFHRRMKRLLAQDGASTAS
ncbi:MAG: hypothetical protein GX410_04400 [Elusimicrobia bacterium]|nr:hypothetical protein [Elusimicrobiota bacterium]